MEQEIQDVIKKNLPAHVGDQLKIRLELCDRLEKENKYQREQIATLDADLALHNNKIEEYKKLKERLDKLDDNERDVFVKQKLLALKEEHTTNRVADAKGFLGLVFNNHRIHKELHHSNTVPVIMTDNGYSRTEYHETSEDKKESQDMT